MTPTIRYRESYPPNCLSFSQDRQGQFWEVAALLAVGPVLLTRLILLVNPALVTIVHVILASAIPLANVRVTPRFCDPSRRTCSPA